MENSEQESLEEKRRKEIEILVEYERFASQCLINSSREIYDEKGIKEEESEVAVIKNKSRMERTNHVVMVPDLEAFDDQIGYKLAKKWERLPNSSGSFNYNPPWIVPFSYKLLLKTIKRKYYTTFIRESIVISKNNSLNLPFLIPLFKSIPIVEIFDTKISNKLMKKIYRRLQLEKIVIKFRNGNFDQSNYEIHENIARKIKFIEGIYEENTELYKNVGNFCTFIRSIFESSSEVKLLAEYGKSSRRRLMAEPDYLKAFSLEFTHEMGYTVKKVNQCHKISIQKKFIEDDSVRIS